MDNTVKPERWKRPSKLPAKAKKAKPVPVVEVRKPQKLRMTKLARKIPMLNKEPVRLTSDERFEQELAEAYAKHKANIEADNEVQPIKPKPSIPIASIVLFDKKQKVLPYHFTFYGMTVSDLKSDYGKARVAEALRRNNLSKYGWEVVG